jgi:hypothetical protein
VFPLEELELRKQCEELIYISPEVELKDAHTNLINFWDGVKEEFPHISCEAV